MGCHRGPEPSWPLACSNIAQTLTFLFTDLCGVGRSAFLGSRLQSWAPAVVGWVPASTAGFPPVVLWHIFLGFGFCSLGENSLLGYLGDVGPSRPKQKQGLWRSSTFVLVFREHPRFEGLHFPNREYLEPSHKPALQARSGRTFAASESCLTATFTGVGLYPQSVKTYRQHVSTLSLVATSPIDCSARD